MTAQIIPLPAIREAMGKARERHPVNRQQPPRGVLRLVREDQDGSEGEQQ